jgi:hypothetical protein
LRRRIPEYDFSRLFRGSLRYCDGTNHRSRVEDCFVKQDRRPCFPTRREPGYGTRFTSFRWGGEARSGYGDPVGFSCYPQVGRYGHHGWKWADGRGWWKRWCRGVGVLEDCSSPSDIEKARVATSGSNPDALRNHASRRIDLISRLIGSNCTRSGSKQRGDGARDRAGGRSKRSEVNRQPGTGCSCQRNGRLGGLRGDQSESNNLLLPALVHVGRRFSRCLRHRNAAKYATENDHPQDRLDQLPTRLVHR